LPNRFDVLGRVRKIEDTNRLWRVQIDEGLTPLGAIDDCAHATGSFHTPPMDFEGGKFAKARTAGQAREVRQRAHLHLGLSVGGCGQAGLADGQRAHLCPLPMHERHHGPIHAQHHLVGGTGGQWIGVQDVLGRLGLERHGGRAGGFGEPGGRGATDIDLCLVGKFAHRFAE
jgi:hypothetical protein